MIIGAMVGIAITHFIWVLHVGKLRIAYRTLLEDAEKLQLEYFAFRRQFEEYRSRFDPVDLKREGNVTYINKGKDE